MFIIFKFFFIFFIKFIFLKFYLKSFIFYFLEIINFDKIWLNFNFTKKYFVLNSKKKTFMFLYFNIFYNYFFLSFLNLILDFYDLKWNIFFTGNMISYQISNLYFFSDLFFILNKSFNLKKKYIYF